MKYKSGQEILPSNLLNKVQDYVQNTYLYIPERNSDRKVWSLESTMLKNIEQRDQLIYDEYKKGTSIAAISNMLQLSRQSIYRVIEKQTRKEEGECQALRNILYKWKIYGDAVPIDHKTWEVNHNYILKAYTNSDDLLQNMEIMGKCEDIAEFVPEVLPNTKGARYLLTGNWYYVVMRKLPGRKVQTIYTYKDSNFFTVGNIIGKIHRTLKDCEEQFCYWNNSLLGEMKGWVSRILDGAQGNIILSDDIEETIQELENKFDLLPKQLVYQNVQLSNFLFINGRISGCVDFGAVQRNIRIIDICNFMVSLLWNNTNNDDTLDKWLRGLELIFQGYEECIKLTDVERNTIACIMKCIQLAQIAALVEKGHTELAKEAVNIYYFIKEHTDKINDSIHMSVL